MVFFYLVTTCGIFYMREFNQSMINQSINLLRIGVGCFKNFFLCPMIAYKSPAPRTQDFIRSKVLLIVYLLVMYVVYSCFDILTWCKCKCKCTVL